VKGKCKRCSTSVFWVECTGADGIPFRLALEYARSSKAEYLVVGATAIYVPLAERHRYSGGTRLYARHTSDCIPESKVAPRASSRRRPQRNRPRRTA
jgi:hypothetical protein